MWQTEKGRGFSYLFTLLELDLIRHQQMAGAILKIFNWPLRSETEHVSTWRPYRSNCYRAAFSGLHLWLML